MIQKLPNSEFRDPYQRLERPIEVPLGMMDSEVVVQSRFPVRRQRLFCLLAALAVTLGGLIVVMNSPWRNEFLAPGALTTSHAQILKDQGHQRCATCHGAGNANFSAWLQDAFSAGSHLNVNQSHLCLACHQKEIGDKEAINPHGLPSTRLTALTNSKIHLVGSISTPAQTPLDEQNVACSVCHREHHGQQFDLTQVADSKCQSCHQQVFDCFERTHTDFQLASHAVDKRAIRFNHRTHGNKHFVEKATSFDCKACHQADADSKSFQTASFEVACAVCHDESLRAATSSGLAWLSVPSVDIEAINRGGKIISNWPIAKGREFDGVLSPIMILLLSHDEVIAKQLAKRSWAVDFFDLNADNEDDLNFSIDLVRSIQLLANEILVDGKAAMKRRLEFSLKRPLSDQEFESLFVGLDEITVKNFAIAIVGSATTRREQRPLDEFTGATALLAMKFDDELLAPNPLTPLMGKRQPKPSVKKSAGKPQDAATPNDVPNRPPVSVIQFPTANTVGELLLDNPLEGKLVRSTQSEIAVQPRDSQDSVDRDQSDQTQLENGNWTSSASVADEYTMGDTDRHKRDSVENLDSARVNQNADPKRILAYQAERLPATESFLQSILDRDLLSRMSVVPTGHWNFNAGSLSIDYLPSGHADAVSKAWIDLMAANEIATESNSPWTPMQTDWMREESTTQCVRCHQTAINNPVVSWRSSRSELPVAFFEKFSHRPHLLLQECTTCHEVDSMRSMTSLDSGSDFQPITKTNCATCHREGQSNNRCTHCHQYHQTQRSSNLIKNTGRNLVE